MVVLKKSFAFFWMFPPDYRHSFLYDEISYARNI